MTARKGASFLEFTFVAIPLMFILISIFELSRGMWMYNTLSHALKESVRFAIVHGNSCAEPPNNCTVTTAGICQQLLNAGPGLETSRVLNMTFRSYNRTVSKGTLANCLTTGSERLPGNS
jgi:Flp pilus assembly protein TadG